MYVDPAGASQLNQIVQIYGSEVQRHFDLGACASGINIGLQVARLGLAIGVFQKLGEKGAFLCRNGNDVIRHRLGDIITAYRSARAQGKPEDYIVELLDKARQVWNRCRKMFPGWQDSSSGCGRDSL